MKVLAISREAFDTLGFLTLEEIGATVASAGNALFYGVSIDAGSDHGNAMAALLADTAIELPEVE